MVLGLMQHYGVGAGISQTICYPQIFGSDTKLFQRRYPVADTAFDQKRYAEAFRAYYQYFFCLGGPTETVNPRAEDSGAAALLRTGIAAAMEGKYRLAIAETQAATARDTQFGEAQFILGDLFFVVRKCEAARAAWRDAEVNPGYPVPPDADTRQPYASAASEMLSRHCTKAAATTRPC
ncbi:MAG: hypothetical protein GIX03_15730 [Candidatus Eremiobacteraeota bacterium]|nr:hypothetical protein [Candidatus Eremiobacteraeota bacterium]MBC5821368.1 hypothetical protein [Candidatus Eremiobacteraeota bacterium]